jgi:hypothetical protein
MGLSVGDGFRFGCGLMLAMLVLYLVMMAVGAVIMVFMMMLGMMPLLLAPQTMSLLLPLA